MNTSEIQDLIARTYIEKNHNPVCTNFKGAGYAESDVISISNSDYVYEFEVKVSKADFKKDFTKVIKHRYLNETHQKGIHKKYRTKKVNRVPNYFYYVCPFGLISIDQIPEYAGLIYVENNILEIIKKAPILHKERATIKLLKRVSRTLTERITYGMALKSYRIKNKK
jgi:hypothetical protein